MAFFFCFSVIFKYCEKLLVQIFILYLFASQSDPMEDILDQVLLHNFLRLDSHTHIDMKLHDPHMLSPQDSSLLFIKKTGQASRARGDT